MSEDPKGTWKGPTPIGYTAATPKPFLPPSQPQEEDVDFSSAEKEKLDPHRKQLRMIAELITAILLRSVELLDRRHIDDARYSRSKKHEVHILETHGCQDKTCFCRTIGDDEVANAAARRQKWTEWEVTENERHSILVYQRKSSELVKLMHPLIKAFLIDSQIAEKIFYVEGILKQVGLFIKTMDQEPDEPGEKERLASLSDDENAQFRLDRLPLPNEIWNGVLRVNLRNGKEYAFDIGGIQYGWKEVVMLFNEYIAAHFEDLDSWETHPNLEYNIFEYATQWFELGKPVASQMKPVMASLSNKVLRYLSDHSIPTDTSFLWDCTKEDFEKLKQDLLQVAETSIEGDKKNWLQVSERLMIM